MFYLHNRVDTIDSCAATIQKLIPDATVVVAHGKMSEEQLSKVWQRLLDHEIDILVCTTIIETGVDVLQLQHPDYRGRGPAGPLPSSTRSADGSGAPAAGPLPT